MILKIFSLDSSLFGKLNSPLHDLIAHQCSSDQKGLRARCKSMGMIKRTNRLGSVKKDEG